MGAKVDIVDSFRIWVTNKQDCSVQEQSELSLLSKEADVLSLCGLQYHLLH